MLGEDDDTSASESRGHVDELRRPDKGVVMEEGTPYPGTRGWGSRWSGAALEAGLAFASAGLFLASCLRIRVDPLDRLGQVSGLASLGLRFTLASLALVAVLLLALRVRPRLFEGALGVACAIVAGLMSGFVAGGLLIALHGTPWCLMGDRGDARVLAGFADWVRGLRYGQAMYPYPPIPVHLLAWYGELADLPSHFALKHLEILGTASFGPVAYLSWRMLFRPIWALGIGVVAALPLIDPYKPYANLVLIAFVPLVICFLQRLRAAHERSARRLLLSGAAYGAGFAVLCLSYAAWFRWSAPGFLVATLVFFPWRGSARIKGVSFLVGAAAAFALLCGWYVQRALAAGIADSYVYFDVLADPAYVAMWRWDLPGAISIWPPLGELGGVGLFTALMAVGLAVALALGRGETPVAALCLLMASAWVLRFWYAHQLWQTRLVQLYPRTSIQILYCLLALCGYAVYGLARRPWTSAVHPGRTAARSMWFGVVCGLLLVFGSAGSAIADRYMPVNPAENPKASCGALAWEAHTRADLRAGDSERERRLKLLQRLRAAFGDQDFDVEQAAEKLAPGLPLASEPEPREVQELERRLSYALRDARDVVLGGLRLVQSGTANGGRARWKVEQQR